MKRITMLLLAAVVVVVAPAAAKTVTIAITKSGYVPKATTIAVGDAVSFVNQDTQAHQLVFKPTTGFTCSAGTTVQPGQTTTCTFRTAATYTVTDPNHKGVAWKATVTVTAATGGGALTLQASPASVVYGGKSTLSGTLATGQANQKVTIQARSCGETSFKAIGTATTTTGGAFSFVVQPAKNTTYLAKEKSTTSSTAPSVTVRPRIALRKLATRKYRVTLLAADSFAGKYVVFQRYNGTLRRWVAVKRVVLRAGATLTAPLNPTVSSTATFRARIKARLRIRAVLPGAQASPCYVTSRSNVTRS
jgi:plastocyanin